MTIQVIRLQADTTGRVVAGQSNGRSPRPACTIIATGSFGSGSLKPQTGFMQTTGTMAWVDISGVTPLTAAGQINFDQRFENLRLVLSGSTTPDIQVAILT